MAAKAFNQAISLNPVREEYYIGSGKVLYARNNDHRAAIAADPAYAPADLKRFQGENVV